MPVRTGRRVLRTDRPLLCTDGPTRTPVELSLLAEHQRGYGSLYGALNHGRLDTDALRDLLISLPLPRFGGRIVPTVDVSPVTAIRSRLLAGSEDRTASSPARPCRPQGGVPPTQKPGRWDDRRGGGARAVTSEAPSGLSCDPPLSWGNYADHHNDPKVSLLSWGHPIKGAVHEDTEAEHAAFTARNASPTPSPDKQIRIRPGRHRTGVVHLAPAFTGHCRRAPCRGSTDR
ncbi:transposase [Streptomyces abikoensis]|uniref:transposase n=1 Tax=Streptomyces abikoensis TaxID=97398 RepID=UPI0036ACF877